MRLLLIRVRDTPPVCVSALPQLMIFHIYLYDLLQKNVILALKSFFDISTLWTKFRDILLGL